MAVPPPDGESSGSNAGPALGSRQPDASPFTAPSISLPKGGGAIRGIGEKFAANPVTGTGSLTVPIAASPGPRRVRPAARSVLRLRRRQRPVRLRLEPRGAVDHAQDRQGPAALPRRRRLGRLHPLGRGGSGPGPRQRRSRRLGDRERPAEIGVGAVHASAATGRASRGCSRGSSAGRRRRRRRPLALDRQGQRHDALRHGPRTAGSPTRPTRGASSRG